MSTCCQTGNSPIAVNVPGPAGSGGTVPIATTANFTVPAVGAQVAVAVQSSSGFRIGQTVFVYGCNFQVFANPISGGSITLTFLGLANDAAVGTVVPAGSLIAFGPGAITGANLVPVAALLPAVVPLITDNSSGAASSTLAAGVGISTLAFYVTLANIANNTDLIGQFTPGYAFKLLSIVFAVEKPVTTGSKLATLTPKIGGSAVTGGVLSLTSAALTPNGTVLAASNITGGNTGTASQTLEIAATAVTAFSEGTGWIIIKIQNTDVRDAFATLASKINSILSAVG